MPHHTQSSGVDDRAFSKGLAEALNLANASGYEMIYLTPSLNALDSDSAVNIVGAQALKALKASGRASWNGVTVILETKRKRQARGPAIVFAPYASLEMLANVEADHRTADFVFVPWAAVELRDYSSAHPNSQVIE